MGKYMGNRRFHNEAVQKPGPGCVRMTNLRHSPSTGSYGSYATVFPAMPISLETVEASIPYHGGFVKLLLNVPIA